MVHSGRNDILISASRSNDDNFFALKFPLP